MLAASTCSQTSTQFGTGGVLGFYLDNKIREHFTATDVLVDRPSAFP
jgi:hypothetical protein